MRLNITQHPLGIGQWLRLVLMLLPLVVGLSAQAQVLVPFTQRTNPANYKIRGDFAMIGNTNLTLVNYGNNTNNSNNNMRYVDIDTDNTTFNSSSATLEFSTENGAEPECSDILYAGLYWTGRTHNDGTSPNTFDVTKSMPTGNFTTQTDNYNIDHEEDIPNTSYELVISRGGPNGDRYPIFTFTDGTNTYVFNFTNNTGAGRVTLSVNGGGATNVPVTYTSSGNTGTATLTTPYVITDGTTTITITQLIRDSRVDRTTGQYQSSSNANVTVTQTVPEFANVTKTFNRQKILLKVPGSVVYEEIEAAASDIYYPASDAFSQGMYSAYKDITDKVQAAGIGEYFVADIALREGNGGGTGYYGGWGMVVIYENYLMVWRDITSFDGHAFVNASVGSSEIPISGFQTTPAGAVTLRVGVMAGEGDVGITGDYFNIRNAADDAWVALNHSGNTTNNFFNSSVVTGGNPRNPNDQNNTGLDISAFTVNNPSNTILANGQTSTRFQYGSSQDAYCIFNITMSSDSYVPEAEGLISVTQLNGSPVIPDPLVVGPGDQIQYTVEIRNIGTEAVLAHTITIPIPYTGAFVPGSLISNIFFAPPPSPNNVYFDPNAGPTGSIIWDFGTLPLPDDPSELLASLTFTIEVYDNCLLLSDDVCSEAIIAIGSLTGIGELTGFGIQNSGLITGYVQNGPCQGEPITDPLSAAIDVPLNWVADNCTPEQLSSDFYFCDGNPTVPVASVATSFPLGTRFFNEFPVVEGVSVEYTTTFPAALGTSITYYAVPPIPEDDECNIAITINICEEIEANDDLIGTYNCATGGSNLLNVLTNDELGGVTPTTSEVVLSIITLDPTGYVTINADGSVDIAAGVSEGPHTVTYQICQVGFPTNCDQAILTVQDEVDPVAVCQNITVALVNGAVTITAAQVNNGSTDNCGIASLSVNPSSFDCDDVGANAVVLTVTDVAGNSSTCNATVTVTATAPPVAICQNITVNLNGAGAASITAAQIDNNSTSACGIQSMAVNPNAFDCSDLGANTVTLTVTDVNGNTATCDATVTIQDNEDPVITCPADIAVNTDAGDCEAVVTFSASATDNCSAVVTYSHASGSAFPVGTTTVTATATDPAGNTDVCTFDIVVTDNEDPVITCPADIAVNTDAGDCEAVVTFSASATDNCSAIVTYSHASGSAFPVGTTTVTATATDPAGNTDVCTFDIVVTDNEDPVITCPTDIAVNTDAGDCEAVVTFSASATDNCSAIVTYSHASGSAFPVGTTTVTATATDPAGNTDVCTFDIVVTDNEDPVITCPADIAVNTDAGDCDAVVTFSASATDNCSSIVTYSHASGSAFPVGITTVTATATDPAGNTDVCTFDIVVTDDEAPVIT